MWQDSETCIRKIEIGQGCCYEDRLQRRPCAAICGHRALLDKNIFMEAVRKTAHALQYSSEELRSDKRIALASVSNDGHALRFASKELRADKEVVLAALSTTGCALEFTAEELRGNRQLALEAFRNCDGEALEFASAELGDSLRFASEEVRSDIATVLTAVADWS